MRFILIQLLFCLPTLAAEITAASCNRDDVNTACQSAAEGDTVIIPAGTCNWDNKMDWLPPANVTLKGAGTSATGGGSQTIIQDNYAVNDQLIDIDVHTNGVFRFTGITVRTGTGAIKDSGVVAFAPNGHKGNIRIDHCTFTLTASSTKLPKFGNGMYGVMHHCFMTVSGLNGMYPYNGRALAADTEGVGNYEWTQATDFGGTNYLYIEDNIFTGGQGRIIDGYSSSKIVLRFNTFTNIGIVEMHATGHAGNDRGCRSVEAYGNLCFRDGSVAESFTGVDFSSGTGLSWGNSWDAVYKHPHHFNVTRKDNATYGQSATPVGWGYAGTAFNGTGSDWDGGTFNSTDTVTGYPCLDQPGRGPGDLLVGDNPNNKVNDAFGTLRWPRQALEPVYMWNNTGTFGSGGSMINNDTGTRCTSDRDFYIAASGIQTTSSSPFNGTTGCGWGTLANRPTTCTTGVGYFATDQGSWNVSSTNVHGVQQNGADGVLYIATATDTWTLYYTPLIYPHPLRAESVSEPATYKINPKIRGLKKIQR